MKIETTGGGGWGDPLERELESVLQDVMEGRVSVAAAHDDYGVVLAEENEGLWQIDNTATEHRRATVKAARLGPLPMIDRGFTETASDALS